MTTTEHLAPLTMFKLFVSKVKLKKATSCMYHKNLPCQVQMSCAGARGQARSVTTALLRAAPVIWNDLGINAHDLTAVIDSGYVLNAIFAMKLEQCWRRAEQCTVHSGCARALCASAQWIGIISNTTKKQRVN